ncbi:MAG: hypothetical protein IH612_04860 [Desulfofustis sp.]|nr:hypothetical protein [Desulfofustis sp.]
MDKMKLSDLSMGKVQARFESALVDVIENLIDPGTELKKDREIIIKLKYRPTDEARETCAVTVQVTKKLQPPREIVSMIGVGIDGNGEVRAVERNQQPLFEEPKARGKIAQING